jgi:hypothetical protein
MNAKHEGIQRQPGFFAGRHKRSLSEADLQPAESLSLTACYNRAS